MLSASREVDGALGTAVAAAAAAAFIRTGLQGPAGGLGFSYGTATMATAVLACVAMVAVLVDHSYRGQTGRAAESDPSVLMSSAWVIAR